MIIIESLNTVIKGKTWQDAIIQNELKAIWKYIIQNLPLLCGKWTYLQLAWERISLFQKLVEQAEQK